MLKLKASCFNEENNINCSLKLFILHSEKHIHFIVFVKHDSIKTVQTNFYSRKIEKFHQFHENKIAVAELS